MIQNRCLRCGCWLRIKWPRLTNPKRNNFSAPLRLIRRSIIRGAAILDDEARLQLCDLARQARLFDGTEYFFKILIGGRRFIQGIIAAVVEDVASLKALIHLGLEQSPDRILSA